VRLDDVVEGRIVRARAARAVADRVAIDQALVDGSQVLVLELEPLQGLAAHVGHEDIGIADQAFQYLSPLGILEVDGDAALVAVDAQEHAGHARMPRRPYIARAVAFEALDLDHVRAQVAEEHRAIRTEQDRCQVDDAHAVQRARHLHVARSIGSSAFHLSRP